MTKKKSWWQKKELSKKEDAVKDIEAIIEFFEDINDDAKVVLPHLERLHELEKERVIAKEGLTPVNLETQAKVIDKLLERYEFFQNDVDVNGIRIKGIAVAFLKHAEKAGLRDLAKEKRQDIHWKFITN